MQENEVRNMKLKLFAIILCFALLVSCGNTSGNNTTDSTESDTKSVDVTKNENSGSITESSESVTTEKNNRIGDNRKGN